MILLVIKHTFYLEPYPSEVCKILVSKIASTFDFLDDFLDAHAKGNL